MLIFALSSLKESQEQENQRKSARANARIEIQHNIERFDRFWKTFRSKAPKEKPGEVMANRIAVIPLPTFSHHVWRNQASVLPEVLEDEELKNGQRLHNDFETFANIHSHLEANVHLANQDAKEWKKISIEPWKELQETYDRIRRIGNPISGN